LLKLIPPHEYYAEAFGGGASLLFAKEPAKVETYNDMDGGLVNMFRVLRDEAQFEKFKRMAEATPYSREEYLSCRELLDKSDDPVEWAYRYFVVARMSFGGAFGGGWGNIITQNSSEMAGTCARWLSTIEMLPQIHARMMSVQVECLDWRKIITKYNVPGYLLYCDPPYVAASRRSGGYKHELVDQDHKDLVQALLEYPAMVMLSGYPNELYKPLEDAGWDVQSFEVSCMVAGRTRLTGLQGAGATEGTQKRTEVVWRNPAAMEAISKGGDRFGQLPLLMGKPAEVIDEEVVEETVAEFCDDDQPELDLK